MTRKKKVEAKPVKTEVATNIMFKVAGAEEPVQVVEALAETQPQTEETTEETHPQEEIVLEEPVEETEAIKPSKPKRGMVKVKVLVGTLQFEGGSYEKGDVFEVSKNRAALFDPKDIEILK